MQRAGAPPPDRLELAWEKLWLQDQMRRISTNQPLGRTMSGKLLLNKETEAKLSEGAKLEIVNHYIKSRSGGTPEESPADGRKPERDKPRRSASGYSRGTGWGTRRKSRGYSSVL